MIRGMRGLKSSGERQYHGSGRECDSMAVFSSVMVIRFIYRHITQYVVEGVVR